MTQPAVTATRNKWRLVRTTVRWLATIALFGWLAYSISWETVWTAFRCASVPWLFAAAAIYLLSQFASVARWELLVRAAGIHAARGQVVAAYFEGMFVNICLPTTIGGDVLKVLRIGGSHHKRLAAATVVADRASGLVALVALLATGLLLKLDSGGRAIAMTLVVATMLVATPAVISGLQSLPAAMAAAGMDHDSMLRRAVRKVFLLVPAVVRRLITHSPWVRVLAWAVVVQSLNVAAVAAAGRAIGLNVSLAGLLVATTTVSLAASLPISIAGLGVREASLPLLLAADGVPRMLAVALGLLWSAIVLAVGLTGGPGHFAAQRRAARAASPNEPVVAAVKDRAA
jgi:uncharacterized protein (TIRG00374 family)